MQKIIYILMLVIAASCSKGEMTRDLEDSDVSITFSSMESSADWGTRGISSDDMDSVSHLMIYALLGGANEATTCYIDHKSATRSGGVWGFSPAYYYPLHESLDFLAYTPEANAAINGITQTLDFRNRAVTFSYNLPIVGRNHPDLMLAAPSAGHNEEYPLDKLSFTHALTQLSMSARVGSATESNRYIITRFTIHDITIGAEMVYSISGGIGEWVETSCGDFITSAMLPDPSLGERPVKLTDEYQSIMSNGHTLFMIPQPIESRDIKPTIQITVYDTADGSELTYRTDRLTLPSPNGEGWKSGQHINLQFAFDVNDDNLVIPMTLTAKLLDWVEHDVDSDVDANIYSYLDKSSVGSGTSQLMLYTNGMVKSVAVDGAIITSAVLGKADSSDNYPITITTGGVGVGSITVEIENSNEAIITKTFNITVR